MRVRLLRSFGGHAAWQDIDMPAPPTPGLVIDLRKGGVTVESVTYSVEQARYRVECVRPDDNSAWDRSPDPFRYLANVETVKDFGWQIAREDLIRADIVRVFTEAGKPVPDDSAFMNAEPAAKPKTVGEEEVERRDKQLADLDRDDPDRV